MRKPSRQYLEDLRGLQEALQRQSERSTRPIRRKAGIKRVPFTPAERADQEQLLRLCEGEIRRVEAAIVK